MSILSKLSSVISSMKLVTPSKSLVTQMVPLQPLSEMQMVKLLALRMVPLMLLIIQLPSQELLVKLLLMRLVTLLSLILQLVKSSMLVQSRPPLQSRLVPQPQLVVLVLPQLHLLVAVFPQLHLLVAVFPQLRLLVMIHTTQGVQTLIKLQLLHRLVQHIMHQHLRHTKHLLVHRITLQLQLTLVPVWVTCILVLQPITNPVPAMSRAIHISKSVNPDKVLSATILKQMLTTTFHSLMTRVLVLKLMERLNTSKQARIDWPLSESKQMLEYKSKSRRMVSLLVLMANSMLSIHGRKL